MRALAYASCLVVACAAPPPRPSPPPPTPTPAAPPVPPSATGLQAEAGTVADRKDEAGEGVQSDDSARPAEDVQPDHDAQPDDAKAAEARPKATRITVSIPGDNPVEAVIGPPDAKRAIVYLHGVCGDPLAFESWIEAAAAHATFISLRGDERCDDRPSRFKWSFDYARLDRRILRALDVVDEVRHAAVDSVPLVPLDRDDVVLIGYSQGAHRVQWMSARFPDRYRRVALIALSTEPSTARLAGAERILIMAGAWDARAHLWEGHNALKKAGKTVLYSELPKARHGDYGPAAQETMAKALDWLFE